MGYWPKYFILFELQFPHPQSVGTRSNDLLKVPVMYYYMPERSCHFNLALLGLCFLKLDSKESLYDEVCLCVLE